MAVVVDVVVFSNFVPLSYPPHFLDGGDVSPAFYEGFRQCGRGTLLIEGPNGLRCIPVNHSPLFVCVGRHH